MSGELYPNVPFLVVRDLSDGRFVRAFLDEGNLVTGGFFKLDTYSITVEYSHEPDENGHIFHIYPPVKEGV